jgi:hypothetical protein
MTKPRKPVVRRIIQFLMYAAAVAMLGHDSASAQQNTITGYNATRLIMSALKKRRCAPQNFKLDRHNAGDPATVL